MYLNPHWSCNPPVTVTDIGSGYGETSIYLALENKNHEVISCDKYINGNLNLLKNLEKDKITNCFLFSGNVIKLLDISDQKEYFDKNHIMFEEIEINKVILIIF